MIGIVVVYSTVQYSRVVVDDVGEVIKGIFGGTKRPFNDPIDFIVGFLSFLLLFWTPKIEPKNKISGSLLEHSTTTGLLL